MIRDASILKEEHICKTRGRSIPQLAKTDEFIRTDYQPPNTSNSQLTYLKHFYRKKLKKEKRGWGGQEKRSDQRSCLPHQRSSSRTCAVRMFEVSDACVTCLVIYAPGVKYNSNIAWWCLHCCSSISASTGAVGQNMSIILQYQLLQGTSHG